MCRATTAGNASPCAPPATTDASSPLADEHALDVLTDDLLCAARRGDARAQRRLCIVVRLKVLRFLRFQLAYVAELDAVCEDLAQETMVHVMRTLERCDATTVPQFMSWVRTIARRRIVDERRRSFTLLDPSRVSAHALLQLEAPQEAPEEDSEIHVDDGASAAAPPIRGSLGPRADVLRVVFAAHDQLDPRTTEILWLRLIRGLAWAEIALEMTSSEIAVRRRYERAILRLRTVALHALGTVECVPRRGDSARD